MDKMYKWTNNKNMDWNDINVKWKKRLICILEIEYLLLKYFNKEIKNVSI